MRFELLKVWDKIFNMKIMREILKKLGLLCLNYLKNEIRYQDKIWDVWII
jgi:hypothetical protein